MNPCVLIFGGTFDPPHAAHLELPPIVAQALGCQRIIYVPAAINPLKTDQPPTPAHHRLEMLRIALRDVADAVISTVEVDRPGPSYMIDTLHELREQLGENIKMHLLIGADQALEFHRWKDWREVLELATPAIILRPPLTRETFEKELRKRYDEAETQRWLECVVDAPMIDVAATDLRRRLAEGRAGDAIPPAVMSYVRQHHLYGL